MATSNLGLDEHWRAFIERQIVSGHYAEDYSIEGIIAEADKGGAPD